MIAQESNFDGLIGPTHNYGGLSDGNLASAKNAGLVARPREAALQGLGKMRAMHDAGLWQGRPDRSGSDRIVDVLGDETRRRGGHGLGLCKVRGDARHRPPDRSMRRGL